MAYRFILLLLLTLRLMNCSAQAEDPKEETSPDFLAAYRLSYLMQETGLPISENSNLLLYDTIATWLGTPYQFAGNCEKGIDCSGFVTVLCDRVYGKRLGARNSSEIYNLVQRIDKEELREGDLVFFRTRNRKISHIGLYLSGNKFVHSSTSKGVIISDLDELYYKKHFAGAGRLKDALAEANDK